MAKKHVFKRLLTIFLWFVLYTIILATILTVREEFIDWKVNTFDLDGNGIYGGIEWTKEQLWWFDLLIHDTRIMLIFLVPFGSMLLTLITCIIRTVVKRIKQQHIKKIVIYSTLLYFLISNLVIILNEVNKTNTKAFVAGVTNEWEYWVLQCMFFAPRLLLLSEILTLITVIIILALDNVKNKKVLHK